LQNDTLKTAKIKNPSQTAELIS